MNAFKDVFDNADAPVSAEPVAVADVPASEPTPEAIVEAAPAVEPVAAVEPQAPVEQGEPERRSVPLPTFLDMRDKLKAAERRAEEAEARAKQPASDIPDPYDDPQGYHAAIQEEVRKTAINTRLQTSMMIADQAHGADKVQAALKWAEARAAEDATFEQHMIAQPHPVDWVVREQQQAADLAEFSRDRLAFARRILAESGEPAAPAPAPAQQPALTPPSRSIAGLSATGGLAEVPTGPMAAWQGVLSR